MQTTISDPRIAACQDILELELSIQAIEDIEREKIRALERVLGTVWNVDDVRQLDPEKDGKAPTELRIPLATIINPGLVKHVREQLAAATATQENVPKDTKSLFDAPKDEFLARMEGIVERVSKGRTRKERPKGFVEKE